jgi:hypothetical protein
LLKPTATFGLGRRGGIIEARCLVQRHPDSRRGLQVIAFYGRPAGPGRLRPHAVVFMQGSPGRGQCLAVHGPGKVIAKIRIDGTVGLLTKGHGDVCIASDGKPRCRKVTVLRLNWRKHGHFYHVNGIGAGRRVVVGFARSLVPVR